MLNKISDLLRSQFGIVAGTVQAGATLAVKLDGSSTTVLQPSTILHKPQAGERVWMLRLGVFALILGVAGGRPDSVTVRGVVRRGADLAVGASVNAYVDFPFTFVEPPIVTATAHGDRLAVGVSSAQVETGRFRYYLRNNSSAVQDASYVGLTWTATGKPAQ